MFFFPKQSSTITVISAFCNVSADVVSWSWARRGGGGGKCKNAIEKKKISRTKRKETKIRKRVGPDLGGGVCYSRVDRWQLKAWIDKAGGGGQVVAH